MTDHLQIGEVGLPELVRSAGLVAEAALRPTMRFVAVKSAETQGRAVAFRTHQFLVRQRTQFINALRGHPAEFGLVAPKGPASLKVLENALEDHATDLPSPVREMGAIYLDQIARLIPVKHGFLYLLAIMDWATRKVLSWRLSNTMHADFCVEALKEAIAKHGPTEIMNSDQGSQFTGSARITTLTEAGVRISPLAHAYALPGSVWMGVADTSTTSSSSAPGDP